MDTRQDFLCARFATFNNDYLCSGGEPGRSPLMNVRLYAVRNCTRAKCALYQDNCYRRFPKNSTEINKFRLCLAEQLGKNVPVLLLIF